MEIMILYIYNTNKQLFFKGSNMSAQIIKRNKTSVTIEVTIDFEKSILGA